MLLLPESGYINASGCVACYTFARVDSFKAMDRRDSSFRIEAPIKSSNENERQVSRIKLNFSFVD